MTFQTYRKIAKGRIDPAPMVDIVFLLLIFLVLSSPYVLQPGIGMIELPSAEWKQSWSFQGLVVTVKSDDMVFFNNQVVSYDKLRSVLKSAAKQSRGQELIIKADRQVSHGTVVKIVDIAFEAGITAVNLATRPGIATAPAAR